MSLLTFRGLVPSSHRVLTMTSKAHISPSPSAAKAAKTTVWSSDITTSLCPPAQRSLSTSPSSSSSSLKPKPRDLPRLPVPELRDTLERYLVSLEPFYDDFAKETGRSVDEVREEVQRKVREFGRKGGVGEDLQRRLKGSSGP